MWEYQEGRRRSSLFRIVNAQGAILTRWEEQPKKVKLARTVANFGHTRKRRTRAKSKSLSCSEELANDERRWAQYSSTIHTMWLSCVGYWRLYFPLSEACTYFLRHQVPYSSSTAYVVPEVTGSPCSSTTVPLVQSNILEHVHKEEGEVGWG